MLLNLRRALVFSLVAIAFTFAYALVGTGLAQVAFKSQADGSITANGSTLIGQNWSDAGPGPPPGNGSMVAPTTPGPTPATPTPSSPVVTLDANGVPGESAASNLGPRSASCSPTPRHSWSTGTSSVSTRRRTW